MFLLFLFIIPSSVDDRAKHKNGKLVIEDSSTFAPQFLFYSSDPKLRQKVYQQIYGVNSNHVKVTSNFFFTPTCSILF